MNLRVYQSEIMKIHLVNEVVREENRSQKDLMINKEEFHQYPREFKFIKFV